MSDDTKETQTESEEIQTVIFKKLPVVLLGALVGLLIVWVALQFIPGAATSAVSG